jgi:iron complex transport system substrate-binding protein
LVFRNYLVFVLGTVLILFSTVEGHGYPQRIVSLGTSVTEELYLLGLGECIVGNTVYCNRPEEAKKKEKVGTVVNISVEKIVSLRPDLVFATSLTDRRQLQKLKELKLNVIEIPAERNFQDICANFLKIGSLVGKYAEAKNLVQEAQARVNSLREKIAKFSSPRVMAQLGANPLFVATQEYFIHDFIEMAGGVNIAKDALTGQYSREEVLRQNPDIILIVTMGITGEQEKETWGKYLSLNAVKNRRIYIIDSDKFCSVTPVSFAETLEEMVKLLHPQIK